MKKTSFNQVQMTIEKKGYGQYTLSAMYKGKEIHVFTNDSEMFDWFDDDNDKTKHYDAKKTAYNRIRRQYLNNFN